MIRLGLLGTTGVGKDTCLKIIQKQFSHLLCHSIRLADPIYEAQNWIYKICQTAKEDHVQDGVLLNFLGDHMRKIAPDILKIYFTKNLQSIDPSTQLVLCSDARPIDIPFLREAGFKIIKIEVDPDIAIKRRIFRGDLSLGSSNHNTELGLTADLYDFQLLNNGTLHEFQERIISVIRRLIHDSNG